MQDFIKLEIADIVKKELYSSLCMAGSSNTYSLCIEYMNDWFLKRFSKDKFKSIYIEGKHVLDDNRRLSEVQKLKRLKPSLAIIPTIDMEFDNEKVDSYPYGIKSSFAIAKYRKAFFNDTKNDVHIGCNMKLNLMNFNFKVRVSSRPEQLDLYNYMNMAFRIGYTHGEYINMDFHVPYQLMIQLAVDLHFKVVDNKVVEVTKFLDYLNKHSDVPFLYKLRTVNGHNEYFIRITDMYVHIATPSMSKDDGELEGHLYNNFIIEMEATVRFPSTNFFTYYSESEHLEIKKTDEIIPGEFVGHTITINPTKIEEVNDKGWEQYLETDYMEENLYDPLIIEMDELFDGKIRDIIDLSKQRGISPYYFLDIKVFNSGMTIPVVMDWDTFTLSTLPDFVPENDLSIINHIIIYADRKYINDLDIELDELYKSRIN